MFKDVTMETKAASLGVSALSQIHDVLRKNGSWFVVEFYILPLEKPCFCNISDALSLTATLPRLISVQTII